MTDPQRIERRRQELWSLLGDLPDRSTPIGCELVWEDDCGSYVRETLTLELNGIEPVPAYFCRSKRAAGRSPVVIYNHQHGGDYSIGKTEAVHPRFTMQTPPYAEFLAELGFHTLAIDAWNFGERRGRSESALFKEFIWKGRVLWGMMVFDTVRATDYAITRPDVDPQRIATLGMSLGSTTAWWHAALDDRVKVCVDICCLSEFETLIQTGALDHHGIYYYVPNLLKHFDTSGINELISPRAHLSLAGLYDGMTPPEGLKIIDCYLKRVYEKDSAPDKWKLLTYPCGHVETAAMRRAVRDWLTAHL